MIREIELLAYLPPFMQKYQEPAAALEAVDPEFAIAWDAAHRILYNHFISTADEYGVRRFEKMLGITPSNGESLDSRRWQVQLKWTSMVSYTLPKLREFLASLLGKDGFLLDTREYYLGLVLINQQDEVYVALNGTLREWLPVNIVFGMESRRTLGQETEIYAGAVRTEYVRIAAEPAKGDVRIAASTGVAVNTAVYKYYKAGYRPGEET